MNDEMTLRIPIISCVEIPGYCEVAGLASTIHCYAYPMIAPSHPRRLPLDRQLTAEAMTLYLRVEHEIREARAEWNHDRFRRLMRLRPRVVARLRRRWEGLNPQPRITLGSLRRRYHANLVRYRYESLDQETVRAQPVTATNTSAN
jgi:hypothetical protein